MASATNQRPIVIKKVKKVVGGGHHGGAWKVAYADFVTAMMAFFLLMWLINTTSPEQRRGIAEFFAPASVSRVASGAGGLLEGTSFAEEGVRHGHSAPVAAASEPQYTSNADAQNEAEQSTGSGGENNPNQDSLSRARTLRETAEFSRAEVAIRQAMQDMPDVAELSRNVIIEQTPEGLRIQIVDQEGRSMFNPGDAQPNDRARRLLAAVSTAIAQLPNRITISGHTDGAAPGRRYASNFELSAARASEARRILQAEGIPADRIYEVAGRADSEPLFADDPTLPGNRRIAITLLREAPPLPVDHDL
ncbi:flagellar motor protein MotB [Candidatus Viadribacter manganicus]|uniref:Chemotaxis protein MotB n=1 Tax=Candidatus Viadribacter manganicus TaxID=1759059 RepID=A0A1B1ADJ9_9PROT|nr:flagellar motor protein MotB [Candidatus Viadribacter manganicus]ANP44631.1 chemotaxis protein MotB [Candidatus Viadribacter manganicus]